MMTHYNFDELEIDYLEVYHHWHPDSEEYAGADCLMTALYNGWMVNKVVQAEQLWLPTARSVNVYTFELRRLGQSMIMPVIANPYVERLIRNAALDLLATQVMEAVRVAV